MAFLYFTIVKSFTTIKDTSKSFTTMKESKFRKHDFVFGKRKSTNSILTASQRTPLLMKSESSTDNMNIGFILPARRFKYREYIRIISKQLGKLKRNANKSEFVQKYKQIVSKRKYFNINPSPTGKIYYKIPNIRQNSEHFRVIL